MGRYTCVDSLKVEHVNAMVIQSCCHVLQSPDITTVLIVQERRGSRRCQQNCYQFIHIRLGHW